MIALHSYQNIKPTDRETILRLACALVLCVSGVLSLSDLASAQVWKSGRSQLMSGKYPAAEASLTQAYRTSKTAQDRADSLKYLGVAQYMQKKEAQAAVTFKAALKLNPRLRLQDTEVADESVIPFFDRQRGAATAAAPATAKPTGIPGRPIGGGTAKGSGAPVTKKAKKTLVRVNSNVPTAQISIDGIAYGSAGSDIEIKPGLVILEIAAPGYIKKAVKITVAPLTSSTLTVNLDKPQPKPKPQPKAQPKAVAEDTESGGAGAIPLPATRAAKGKKTAGKKAKSTDLFSGDSGGQVVDDFGGAPVLGPPPSAAAQAQAIAPPSAPQQPMLPPGAYAQPMYQQPMYQQPMYQQPMYQQPMYQQPMYQQPMYQQPMYQQPMPQPQYGPPPPPSVYNPYGGGSSYQQPMAPTAPLAPAYDPLAAAPPVEPIGPSALPPATTVAPPVDDGMPPPMRIPHLSSKKKTAAGKKTDGCSAFIKLLPFGAGQFCQGSTMKGVLFAGAEIGALYFYKQNSDAAVQYQSQLNAVLAQRDVDQAPGVDAAYDQETADKAAAGKATIDKANQNATLSLAVFGGAWALGVVDAFVFAPTPKAKKSMKRARLSLKLEQDYHQSQKPTLALLSPLSTDVSEDAIWYAGYAIPVAPQDRGAVKVGVAWEL